MAAAKMFLIRWYSSSTHLKVFLDLKDFWDDLPVSRLKYNALDLTKSPFRNRSERFDDFQEVFQTTSRKSSRRLTGSLPDDLQEVFQTTYRKSSRRLPGLPGSLLTKSSSISSGVRAFVNVGVENGYDEVNVQIPAKYKYVFSQQIMLDQENVATPVTDKSEYDDRNTDEPSSVITLLPHMHAVRSLRSDRAPVPLGRYVATETESKLGHYQRVLRPCGDGVTEVLRIQEKVTARRAVYHYDRRLPGSLPDDFQEVFRRLPGSLPNDFQEVFQTTSRTSWKSSDEVLFHIKWIVNVGVENGYDEVNVQIPAKYKYVFSQQIMLDQENVATPVTDRSEYDDRNTDEPSSVITLLPHMHAIRSLRSDRAPVLIGRYAATELFRNIDTTINPCILVYPSMLSPEDRSEPISCFPPF
ncbi:hypothetical protein F2Q68_00021624 [Brassica cretica]|uniref:Uncharacterized protein n=1 Tax=Brassica cretica TaxID=69181 RepID=A0A8S9FZG2_BRACR|nr:hypothetical protein F2Q68_00021624 [Brassica cretica]